MEKVEWRIIYEKYSQELRNVIKFWEDNCVDEKYGGYFTFLDKDGSIYDTRKYMWMQWRIVYMFATLYSSEDIEGDKAKWLEIAKQGFEFLTTFGKDEKNEYQYYFGLNREGTPIVAPYNIYSQCFAMMGAAGLYRATGEEKYKLEAISAMESYVKRMDNPKMHWNKTESGTLQWRSHGHYMILANLGSVIQECLNDDSYNSQIDKSIDIIINHFWNEEYGVLFENLDMEYQISLDSCDGRHLIPGHGLESCWFMLQYADKKGDNDLIEKITHIIKSILNFSWDKQFGGIFYFMDVLGKPKIELECDMKLWWVHNEALIATLYGYKLTHDEELLDWFKKIDEWTWNHFPDTDEGCSEWYGYLNRRGEPTNLLKGGKWKTFFHLPRYLHMVEVLMKEILDEEKKIY